MTLDRLWLARCPVPTASGLAFRLGWLDQEFARDQLPISILEDVRDLRWWDHSHAEPIGLFREGGNIPAITARSRGAATRLIGLTWIDERQAILVRPEVGGIAPSALKGMRVALPAFRGPHGESSLRGMTLRGIQGALALAGLTLDDVNFVEVPLTRNPEAGLDELVEHLWSGIDYLAGDKVDAVYVKGASAVDAAMRAGVSVGIHLDDYPSRTTRVNNGTPRPITVHQSLLDDHFDIVVRFLVQALRAANWAASNLPHLRSILEVDTYAGPHAVATAYRNGFHLSLHPALSQARIDLLKQQARFLWLHGFLERAVDVDDWVDARALEAAQKILSAERAA